MKRVHAVYSGMVQGVCFRSNTYDIAQKMSVSGYVKNLVNGNVEIVAEADENELNMFLYNVENEMGRYIREKQISWEPGTGEFSGFQIKY
ncbi:MAG: acylphosphatase [Candidatus Margulisiibacteriota bacterium]|nr:acylphosphatase [Candidatus Margulisiibacteriota bacterium]